MFRQIANRIKGIKKTTDENLRLQEALALLNGFNGNTKGSIHYDMGGPYFNLKGVAPKDMVDFIKDKFHEQSDFYTEIRHQIYSCERYEKHHLHLVHGRIMGKLGPTVVKGSQWKEASIDFVVEKEE